MSNEITIEQMNLTIARFMGMEGTEEFIRQNYQYHKSWDLLMPCWDIFRTVVADHFDEDYPAEYCSMCDVWALHCEHVNINGAHRLLHDAIQWYNQQASVGRLGQLFAEADQACANLKELFNGMKGRKICSNCGIDYNVNESHNCP